MARTVAFQDNTAAHRSGGATRCPDCADGVGKPRSGEPGSWRDRVRRKPGLASAYRVAVFVVGLLCILLGVALTVLPGPLTIPPILVGLWVWSTEFEWARRLFVAFRRKARDAWQHARKHPVSSAAVTLGGLVAAGVAVWAVNNYHLVDRATTALGR